MNSSVVVLNLDKNDSVSEIFNTYPVDISEDPVTGEIYVVSNSSLLVVDSTGIVELLRFDFGVPIALDVFEVFAYVMFDYGLYIQVNTLGRNAGSYVCYYHDRYNHQTFVHAVVEFLGTNNESSDIVVLHPLKKTLHSSEFV